MSATTDPLDLNIEISDDERELGALSEHHRRLGTLLLHTRGYVILRNAIPTSLVTDLRKRYEEMYEESSAQQASGTAHTPDEQGRTDAPYVFWERAGRFRIFPKLQGPFADRHVLRNPFVDPLISGMLGEDYYCKFLSSDTCVKGSTVQPPHRDIGYYRRDEAFGYLVNIPLMHCGLHNGPIEVWPGGSHLWRAEQFARHDMEPFVQDGVNPDIEELAAFVPSKKLELHPGEIMVRDPGMWHRGTPNETDDPRIMLTGGYFRRSYYYQYGDTSYNLDAESYRALPDDVAALFAPMFDRSDLRYWKMRRDRAVRQVAERPHAGEAMRGARRLAKRAKNSLRDTKRYSATDS